MPKGDKGFWTPEECDLLLQGMPLDEVSRRTGRSLIACRCRLRGLRVLGRAIVRTWTEGEDARLIQLSKVLPVRDIAKKMGRTRGAIHARMARLGISPSVRVRHVRGKLQSIPAWSCQDVINLYQLAEDPSSTLADAARVLGRTRGGVKSKCQRLGIRWDQGLWSAADIAREFGYSVPGITYTLRKIFPDHAPPSGVRWKLTDKQAERARRIFRSRVTQHESNWPSKGTEGAIK